MRCGTSAGYWRHHRAGTVACPACKAAWSAYVTERRNMTRPRESTYNNREQTAMDELLAENPPLITWRKNNHGIWVHVAISDPHAERGTEPVELCKRRHPFDEANTIIWPDGTRHCRECKRMRDRESRTPLLAAARTEI